MLRRVPPGTRNHYATALALALLSVPTMRRKITIALLALFATTIGTGCIVHTHPGR
jgi:hypothetical protein